MKVLELEVDGFKVVVFCIVVLGIMLCVRLG